ncbi:MAG: GNAT family N-acetyltransferase [Bacteroidetes bacterium]|nr:GNAT family N-acetyltransferase [Bacteroidota bacterium]
MTTLRPISTGDSEAFYQLVQNNRERLADYFPITIEKAQSLNVAAESIKLYNILAAKKELYVYLINCEENNRAVGMVFLKNIDPKTSKCEIAYFIDKNEEGRGMTKDAVGQALQIAFDQLQLNKVYCRVDTKNERSNKLAEKSGFQLEGVLKQEFRIHDGSLVDLNYYGRFKN